MEKVVNETRSRRVIAFKRLFDVVVRHVLTERNEPNRACFWLDANKSSLVEAIDDVENVLHGAHINPRATFSSSCVRVRVRFDVQDGAAEVRAKNVQHFLNHFSGAFTAQLTNENA